MEQVARRQILGAQEAVALEAARQMDRSMVVMAGMAARAAEVVVVVPASISAGRSVLLEMAATAATA